MGIFKWMPFFSYQRIFRFFFLTAVPLFNSWLPSFQVTNPIASILIFFQNLIFKFSISLLFSRTLAILRVFFFYLIHISIAKIAFMLAFYGSNNRKCSSLIWQSMKTNLPNGCKLFNKSLKLRECHLILKCIELSQSNPFRFV